MLKGEASPVTLFAVLAPCRQQISFLTASLRRLNLDGVVYRDLEGSPQPKALLSLASRRGDLSAVVRRFLMLVGALSREPKLP